MRVCFRPPFRLVIVHTILILFFAFSLGQRWFITSAPHDCFYVPFMFCSGPLAYAIAHSVQHWSERFLSPDQVMISWIVVPAVVCMIFGGLQWLSIEAAWTLWHRTKANVANAPDETVVRS